MAAILPLPLPAPGSLGVNTEADPTQLGPQWATRAVNCVIDNRGQLAARKGWAYLGDPIPVVSNGDFSVDAYWTKGAGWGISGGVAWNSLGSGALSQDIGAIEGRTYVLTYTILNYGVGTNPVIPSIGGAAGTGRTADGTYEDTIVCGSSGSSLSFSIPGGATYAEIDNVTVTGIVPGDGFEQCFEYLDEDGNSEIIFTASNSIWHKNGAANTEVTSTTTPTAGNWKFQNFNDYVVGWQANHAPIVWQGTSVFTDISFTYPSTGTNTWGNEVLAAFGRLWTTDSTRTVIKYSDLLIYNSFTDDAGANGDPSGSAGIIDLKKVWPNGMDYVEAIAEFNGRLVIFGERSIIVYAYPWDPATSMQLEDTIEGIGCLSRNSVQHIGEDIVFLSSSGVRALGRTIQEESAPIGDLTQNVRKDIASAAASEAATAIKSAFNQKTGEYYLVFPTSNLTYVLNFKRRLPDGMPKITTWSLTPLAIYYATTGVLYTCELYGLATITGYRDNGEPYPYSYSSPYLSALSFSTDVGERDLIPKRMKAYFFGGSLTRVDLKWVFDFSAAITSKVRTITLDYVEAAEWGVAEWGVAEFGGGATYSIKRVPMAGHGKIMQIKIEAYIDGYPFSVQRLDAYTKLGSLLK